MATVRCPNCDVPQPDTEPKCRSCGASLTEIVVGYDDRAALADDRDQLESEGWRIVEIKQGAPGEAAFAVRFSRLDAPFVAKQEASARFNWPLPRWASAICLAFAVAGLVAVAALARGAGSNATPAVATPGPATLSVTGTGVPFTAVIGRPDSSRTVDAISPATFRLDPSPAYAAVIQKQTSAPTLLSVTLTCSNGRSFSWSTVAGFGSIFVSERCL